MDLGISSAMSEMCLCTIRYLTSNNLSECLDGKKNEGKLKYSCLKDDNSSLLRSERTSKD